MCHFSLCYSSLFFSCPTGHMWIARIEINSKRKQVISLIVSNDCSIVYNIPGVYFTGPAQEICTLVQPKAQLITKFLCCLNNLKMDKSFKEAKFINPPFMLVCLYPHIYWVGSVLQCKNCMIYFVLERISAISPVGRDQSKKNTL